MFTTLIAVHTNLITIITSTGFLYGLAKQQKLYLLQ